VVLHQVTEAGGLGFCHPALPGLLPPGYHGPLVVALDSDVLIDLKQYGAVLLNDEPLPEPVAADDDYAGNLSALADLLDLPRALMTTTSRTRLSSHFLGSETVSLK